MRTLVICLSVLAIHIPTPASAQTPVRPEILILGTYHMANPGRDVHNMQADDVLAETRQLEMAELIDVLKGFRPTKIAIESQVGSRGRVEAYTDYLAGEYTLTSNEIDQIGFRLAKELGHQAIYPVDEDGEFQFYRVQNYAIANGLEEKFDSIQATTSSYAKQQGDFLRSHTVLETLGYINADSTVAKAVAAYYNFVPFGERFEYAGSDLIAHWFQRNIRIYRNIHALITSPNERVLVVYGAGHLGWFRQIVANDASAQLRQLSDLIHRPR